MANTDRLKKKSNKYSNVTANILGPVQIKYLCRKKQYTFKRLHVLGECLGYRYPADDSDPHCRQSGTILLEPEAIIATVHYL